MKLTLSLRSIRKTLDKPSELIQFVYLKYHVDSATALFHSLQNYVTFRHASAPTIFNFSYKRLCSLIKQLLIRSYCLQLTKPNFILNKIVKCSTF